MLALVQFTSVLLVAVAMAMALAHALEYPGKLRLSKEAYIAMQAVYWTMTHPVNSFWLKDTTLGGAGKGFFDSDPLRTKNENRPAEWTNLRDQWEYSHVIRAALGLASLAMLTGSLVA